MPIYLMYLLKDSFKYWNEKKSLNNETLLPVFPLQTERKKKGKFVSIVSCFWDIDINLRTV